VQRKVAQNATGDTCETRPLIGQRSQQSCGSPSTANESSGEALRHETRLIGIDFGSYFDYRNWIGFEQISLMVYDGPDLVEEIIETSTVLVLSQLERALAEVQVDFAAGWEEICFRNDGLEVRGTPRSSRCEI
jgi:hypothetical protein